MVERALKIDFAAPNRPTSKKQPMMVLTTFSLSFCRGRGRSSLTRSEFCVDGFAHFSLPH